MDLRHRLSLEARNHSSLQRAGSPTPAKAKAILAERWKHPRFFCHAALLAEGGFVAWRNDAPPPAEIQLQLRMDHGGRRQLGSHIDAELCCRKMVLYWLATPASALAALRDLIDHNAWVRHLDLAPATRNGYGMEASDDGSCVFNTVHGVVERQLEHRR
jgi:hypothetical protein